MFTNAALIVEHVRAHRRVHHEVGRQAFSDGGTRDLLGRAVDVPTQVSGERNGGHNADSTPRVPHGLRAAALGLAVVARAGQDADMTSLHDRPNTALVVVDVQNGVVANAHLRDQVIANINTLVDKARAEDVPVIWVQHSADDLVEGSEEWQYVPELQRHDDEPLVHKHYGDSFEATTLEAELAQRGVGRVIVTGAQTDACIRATLHGAFVRGYDTTLVSDAHTTEDFSEYGLPPVDKVIAHTNMYWTWQGGPGRTAEVVETGDVTFS